MRVREVFWKTDSEVYYSMMRVRPIEIETARKQQPNLLGIPIMYSIAYNGEVDWFPDTMKGMPVVVTDP